MNPIAWVMAKFTSARDGLRAWFHENFKIESADATYGATKITRIPTQGGEITVIVGNTDRHNRPFTRILIESNVKNLWKCQIPSDQSAIPNGIAVELVRLKHPPKPVEEMIDISGERGVLDAIVNGGSM